ncbi:MAG: hypothetical protein QNJ55_30850, partial [Xenococcus sp. MO_188.B8]|nr:hypothetical protein [Xenococcus sp. MO_188.B8]
MPEAFSFNREFDFVRLEGLRKATGQPAHDWDLYIIKELIDNALDADENLWREKPNQFPRIRIRIEYNEIPDLKSQELFVEVSNRSIFPVEKINDIFATQWYTSRKAFFKGLTRGALGNALKTLLGIPYALRERLASDWNPGLNPMSIVCQGKKYLPRYLVDSTHQTIEFECKQEPTRRKEGTSIAVGVDHFSQELPRTLDQLQELAKQYHICNPHFQFEWSVDLLDQEWEQKYQANQRWKNKFQGIAPIHWYSLTAFQDVLGALHRQSEINELLVEDIYQYFALSEQQIEKIPQELRQKQFRNLDLEAYTITDLYRNLCQNSLLFNSKELGCIGKTHIQLILKRYLSLSLESKVFYEIITDNQDDPSIPFVIEAAIAPLIQDNQREVQRLIWTAINFTPTYTDPFSRRWLNAPVQPKQSVLGVRGILDAYELRENTPLVLFIHLICPNIEHNDFSKTEINHLPFKEQLGNSLDRLLETFKQARDEEELKLERIIFQSIDDILDKLDIEEKFAVGQLIEKLQIKLRKKSNLISWLDRPDALTRLRIYVTRYQNKNPEFALRLVHLPVGLISLPLHPKGHLTLSTEQLSSNLLEQYYVSKIIYSQVQELEQTIIDNGWLCQMDMALLHNSQTENELKTALLDCVRTCDLPIIVIHNVSKNNQNIVTQMISWLKESYLDTNRIVDLGLHPSIDNKQPKRLTEMMSGEL